MSKSNLTKPQLIKTQLCPWNLQGRCRRGPTCNYAHSIEEMKTRPDLRYTSWCRDFIRNGTCPRGQHCNFAHSGEQLRSTTAVYKTQFCPQWRAGRKCHFGKHCRFAHGDHELRTTSLSKMADEIREQDDLARHAFGGGGSGGESSRHGGGEREMTPHSAPSGGPREEYERSSVEAGDLADGASPSAASAGLEGFHSAPDSSSMKAAVSAMRQQQQQHVGGGVPGGRAPQQQQTQKRNAWTDREGHGHGGSGTGPVRGRPLAGVSMGRNGAAQAPGSASEALQVPIKGQPPWKQQQQQQGGGREPKSSSAALWIPPVGSNSAQEGQVWSGGKAVERSRGGGREGNTYPGGMSGRLISSHSSPHQGIPVQVQGLGSADEGVQGGHGGLNGNGVGHPREGRPPSLPPSWPEMRGGHGTGSSASAFSAPQGGRGRPDHSRLHPQQQQQQQVPSSSSRDDLSGAYQGAAGQRPFASLPVSMFGMQGDQKGGRIGGERDPQAMPSSLVTGGGGGISEQQLQLQQQQSLQALGELAGLYSHLQLQGGAEILEGGRPPSSMSAGVDTVRGVPLAGGEEGLAETGEAEVSASTAAAAAAAGGMSGGGAGGGRGAGRGGGRGGMMMMGGAAGGWEWITEGRMGPRPPRLMQATAPSSSSSGPGPLPPTPSRGTAQETSQDHGRGSLPVFVEGGGFAYPLAFPLLTPVQGAGRGSAAVLGPSSLHSRLAFPNFALAHSAPPMGGSDDVQPHLASVDRALQLNAAAAGSNAGSAGGGGAVLRARTADMNGSPEWMQVLRNQTQQQQQQGGIQSHQQQQGGMAPFCPTPPPMVDTSNVGGPSADLSAVSTPARAGGGFPFPTPSSNSRVQAGSRLLQTQPRQTGGMNAEEANLQPDESQFDWIPSIFRDSPPPPESSRGMGGEGGQPQQQGVHPSAGGGGSVPPAPAFPFPLEMLNPNQQSPPSQRPIMRNGGADTGPAGMQQAWEAGASGVMPACAEGEEEQRISASWGEGQGNEPLRRAAQWPLPSGSTHTGGEGGSGSVGISVDVQQVNEQGQRGQPQTKGAPLKSFRESGLPFSFYLHSLDFFAFSTVSLVLCRWELVDPCHMDVMTFLYSYSSRVWPKGVGAKAYL
uniref:C3H1-type domain-containing protein n=1 Tax=Chromera velia CCMP2878 TaxID=1169474 RepID=A0A0G4GT98_9ALVE|eukprot:Cvel_23282.t1-p1 / transcript=Cvel_23282.t1 / gene=Cvel_23282 / organism=Chromera_velia_CCMP2878 / gene_product=Zinc finger protein 36, C3H1 type-like 1, putative / transcript_product=Zinc finger protein 36, C3H1 type-like 1, putative / location=Cvel_scaffold2382:5853-27459(-) / protein_length=1118 / sequence_SO=supercontig / SO=protein_coding / is_pseudo=false